MVTDTIDGVILDSDEEGFYLILSGQNAEYRFNIHGIAQELYTQSQSVIGPWYAELQDAARSLARSAGMNDEEADRLLGIKHPDHHDVMSGISDDAA